MAGKTDRNKWAVLVAATSMGYLVTAEVTCTSIILVELFRAYPHDKPLLGWLSGLNISLGVMISLLLSQIISRVPQHLAGAIAALVSSISMVVSSFSPNLIVLFIAHGLIVGLCNGFYFLIPSVTLQQYFKKKRTLAQGLYFSAMSLGFLTYAPFIRLMVDHFSWRGALLLHAGINLHSIPCFLFIRAPKPAQRQEQSKNKQAETKTASKLHISKPLEVSPQESSGTKTTEEPLLEIPETDIHVGTQPQKENTDIQEEKNISMTKNANDCIMPNVIPETKKAGLCELLKAKPVIMLFMLGMALIQGGNLIPFALTPFQASVVGASDLQGALLISVAAAVNIVLRITCGYIGDRKWSHTLLMSSMGAVFGGILTAMISLTQTYNQLAVLIVGVSVFSATFMSTWSANIGILVGCHFLVLGNGLSFSAFGFGNFMAFVGTGLFMDATGGPYYVYLTFGVAECIGGLLFLAIFIYTRIGHPPKDAPKDPSEVVLHRQYSCPLV